MPLDSLSGHRRIVGHYNAKLRQPSKKSMINALKKAHNSHECLRSQRTRSKPASSNTHAFSTIVKIALVASVVAATIPSTAAISNGISREGNANAINLFPRLGTSKVSTTNPSGICSSIRIAPNKVLTAKHCTPIRNGVVRKIYVKDSRDTWMQSRNSWDLGSADPNLLSDLAVHQFPRNPKGTMFCVPLMSNDTYQMLKEAPPSICGLNGRFIMLGYGTSDNTGAARAAVFDPLSFIRRNGPSAKTSPMLGAPINERNDRAVAGSGDSGAAVLGCNPMTGQYELVGTHVQSTTLKRAGEIDLVWGNFVNFPEHAHVRDWVNSHRGICTEANINPNDVYDTSIRNNGEKHQLDRCKLPTKYYHSVGMSSDEISDCFEKIGDPKSHVDCFHFKELGADPHTDGVFLYKARNTCDYEGVLNFAAYSGSDYSVSVPAHSEQELSCHKLKTDGNLSWGPNMGRRYSYRVRDFFDKKMVFPESDIPKGSVPKPSRDHMGEAECLYLTLRPNHRFDVGNWCAPWREVSFKYKAKDGREVRFSNLEYSKVVFNFPYTGEIDFDAGLWFSRHNSRHHFTHIPNYFKEPARNLRGSASCVNIYETKTFNETTDSVETQGHIENSCNRGIVINFQETDASGFVSTVTVNTKKNVSFPVKGEIDRSKGTRVNFVGENAFFDFSHYLNEHPAPADPQKDFKFPDCATHSPLPDSLEETIHVVINECKEEIRFQIKTDCLTSSSYTGEIDMTASPYGNYFGRFKTKSAESNVNCANPFTEAAPKE